MAENYYYVENVALMWLILIIYSISLAQEHIKWKSKSQGADSWFPGYSWRICVCPHCGHHLGWTFSHTDSNNIESDEVDTFHGLILSSILGENFTDSLIMMPKMYKM
ncbi:uncharacterized protein LOC123705711 [Colias croceus]|uniref:uncharacterized protein LOC123705711 n=1 Tax=Colias crocea TaxID=72248 RepID=UPI001E280F43|nr:uncharacterized protein LOC123705711 [Colias croceus]